MILFLHNRYRTPGGEERTVEDLRRLVAERLHEPAELLARDSLALDSGRAALGLLRGGLRPADVSRAVRLSGARVVHVHNPHPAFGWRALAAARQAGARVVLHLHQYRLVCAVGVCYTRGAECTRCHGRHTLPGVRLNCRESLPESLAYGAALSLWQRRLIAQAHAFIVPSRFTRERLRALGAPLPWERVHVLSPPLHALDEAPVPRQEAQGGGYALIVARLAPEKGVEVAIDACRLAGLPLLVAGEGPQRAQLEGRAADGDVRFVGRLDDAELARLRARAAVALVPSRSAETFGMAAAEAIACGLPVAASAIGALPELLDPPALAPPGDAPALAAAIARVMRDPDLPRRNLQRVHALCAPASVARGLAEIYDGARGGAAGTGAGGGTA